MPPLLSRRAVVGGGVAALVPWTDALAVPPLEAKLVNEDNRLWVGARIGDSEPLLFVIDTGAASNFIRPELAKRLNLPVGGGGMVGGIGGRRATTAIVEARDVVIGGVVRQKRMAFSTYDFDRGLPADAAGLFAAGLFTAYDSDVSIEKGRWRLWTGGREGLPEGIRLDSSMISERPGAPSQRIRLDAVVDGKPYRFMVDTGAPGGITLFPRATTRSGLLQGRPFALRAIRGFGGAASKPGRVVRAERLLLGPLNLRRPFVTLMDPSQSLGFEEDGLIGLGLIRLFDFATDVSANRLWLKRNTTPAGPETYPLSGLWLRGGTDAPTTVDTVSPGSPAAQAGITPGDVVIAPSGFADVLRAINGPAGAVVPLSVERGGVRRDVQVTLTEYL